MEGQSRSISGVSKTRRIPYRTIKELGAGHKINGRSAEEHKKAI